ncbi:hypothetical protein G647_00338 [Cladophialophora carrionii CBS 160.54]|uniref:NTF2-like domain-containing protein n=1 Tax=Cladophialophora carrionii CBS 160.54 TaxID=1279043 RepID=V9DLW9_9EURO|nr:uncharacterized protein G647_00338 [Cladophialophora carrionii CBS 160.54]ETI27889.1 hypothetical protein G647_00338 [Cladophialophora carrionii CBS 160.54]
MHSTILASLALLTAVFARPQGDWSSSSADVPAQGDDNGSYDQHYGHGMNDKCLTKGDVQTLIDGYTYLLEYPGGPEFNKTADSILSDKFVVWSDSINTLGSRPLGTPAFPSLQAFIASQSVTPPLPDVETLSTFHNCDQISWRWNATGIQNPQVKVSNPMPVLGLITFSVDVEQKKIDTVYSEFNTAAFLHDLGNPECQQH